MVSYNNIQSHDVGQGQPASHTIIKGNSSAMVFGRMGQQGKNKKSPLLARYSGHLTCNLSLWEPEAGGLKIGELELFDPESTS